MSVEQNSQTLQQLKELLLKGLKIIDEGAVISPPPVEPTDPTPIDPTEPTPVKPKEQGVILHGGWGGNPDPKTWSAAPMVDEKYKGLWKIIDDKKINILQEFSSQKNAEDMIKWSIANLPTTPPPTEPTEPTNPSPGVDEVAGIKFPYKTTGKVRIDDYHYNPNNGLRIDFQDNPKNGSYVNSALAVYGYFKDDPTAKEDRCVKWSWANHTGSDTLVNTYIVNIRNNDGASRMRFEQKHPSGYHTLEDWGTKGTPAKKGQLWSIMGIRRTVLDASGKPVAVKLEVYEDQGIVDNKPGNKWVKLREHTDTNYKIFDYKNGMEVTGRFDHDGGDKNIKIEKAVLVEIEPIKQA